MLLKLALLGAPAALAGTFTVTDDEYPAREDTQLSVPTAELAGVLDNDTLDTDTCVFSTDVTELDGNLAGGALSLDGSFHFTPNADFNGATTFTYVLGSLNESVCETTGQPAATVTITVEAVNDPPTVVLDSVCSGHVTVAEDSGAFDDPGHCVEMSAFGPPNEDSQSFDEWVVSSTNPALFSSAPSITAVDTTFGRLHFTPANNANGTSTVTVRGRDSGGTADGVDLSDPVQFDITVTPVNDAPTAVADSFFALADRTLNVGAPGVLINDGDVDSGSISAVKVSNPAHGLVTLAADGSFSYTPAAGYEGPDAFSYRAFDGSLSSPTRVVSLTVSTVPPVNTPTPFPSPAPTVAPTPEPTVAEPSGSAEATPSLEPGETPAPTAAPSLSPSPEPGATQAPAPSSGEGGGVSLPVLLVIVLFMLLLGFGAAVYVPKWLKSQQTGTPMDDA